MISNSDVDNILEDESLANEPDPAEPMLRESRIVRCEIVRSVSIRDVAGGGSSSFIVVGSYMARLGNTNTVRPAEKLFNDQLLSQSEYIVALPLGANIIPKDRIAIPGYFPTWKPNQMYLPNALIIPATKKSGMRRYYISQVGGLSGATEPNWPIETSSLVTDGAVTWKNEGEAINLEIVGMLDHITSNQETLIHASEVL